MNNTLSKAFIFAAGAIVGAAVAWKLLKEKYERIAQEEIESVKEAFASTEKKEVEADKASSLDKTQMYKDAIDKYRGALEEKERKEEEDVKKPYTIAPDELGDLYDIQSLTYYNGDDILVDEDENVIDDAVGMLGHDFQDGFGEYEDDSVCIRNDFMQKDFQILLDYGYFNAPHSDE